MLRSASGAHYPAPISPLQSGGTPVRVRSTRVKAVLGCAGLLIATASAAVAAPAAAAKQGGASTHIEVYKNGESAVRPGAAGTGADGPRAASPRVVRGR